MIGRGVVVMFWEVQLEHQLMNSPYPFVLSLSVEFVPLNLRMGRGVLRVLLEM